MHTAKVIISSWHGDLINKNQLQLMIIVRERRSQLTDYSQTYCLNYVYCNISIYAFAFALD